MNVSGEQISEAAKRLVGIPFAHQGRDRSKGLDCGGVVITIFDEFNMPYTEDLEYPLRPSVIEPHLLRIAEALEPLERVEFHPHADIEPQLKPGYILILGFANRQLPQHCGIITSTPGAGAGISALTDLSLVHSNTTTEKCAEELIGLIWYRRIIAVFKFKGVEY